MKQLLKIPIIRYSLYLLAVVPLFLFRDFTLDNELRYLSIADEALRNGSFFTFTNHGILYADKPPLYIWIVMAGKQLFGFHSLLFLGLFSFIPALVIVSVMDRWVKNILSDQERLAAELLLLTSSFFIGTAIVVRMDMLMCMFIVLSLFTFFKMYNGTASQRDTFLFPFYLFMALFSKGPVGIIVPLVSTTVFLVLKKDISSIGNYWGWKTLAIVLCFCALWFAGVYAEGGSSYLNNLVFHQTLNRAVNSFHHSQPFYYYLISLWYSLIPWPLLFIGIVIMGCLKKIIPTDLERFFLAIALSTLAVLSLFSAKLAVYLLPSFPFWVYLCVLWLKRFDDKRWIAVLALVPAFLLVAAFPGVLLSQYFELKASLLILFAALILSVAGAMGIRLIRDHQLKRALITMSSSILLSVFIISFDIPKYNPIIGLGELCNKAKTISMQKGVSHYYYCKMDRADNLDVYLGVEPEKLTIKDLYQADQTIQKPAVLFLYNKSIQRNDSLRHYIKGKKMYQSGNYYCVEIDL